MAAPNVVTPNQPKIHNPLVAVLNVNVGTLSAVNANTTAEQTVTVNGLAVGDFVAVSKPTAQAGLGIVGCRVTAANTLGITFSNNTGAGITPTASQIYTLFVARSNQSTVPTSLDGWPSPF